MTLIRTLVAAALLAGCATVEEPSPAASAIAIITAEREFAADAAVRGWAAAFRRYAAPDATTLSPEPVNAQENLAQFEGDGETTLDWRPAYAGVSRSGDFGFTTGPFQFRGREGIVAHYFTVWRRQPDGSWKWIFDAGTGVVDPGPIIALDAVLPELPIAETGSRSALPEVRLLEGQILDAEALAVRLSADARVNRPGAPPAIGGEASAALALSWSGVRYGGLIRMDVSNAGDMIFALGNVSWREGETDRNGHFARIWQHRPEGWRVVFDEIVPSRQG